MAVEVSSGLLATGREKIQMRDSQHLPALQSYLNLTMVWRNREDDFFNNNNDNNKDNNEDNNNNNNNNNDDDDNEDEERRGQGHKKGKKETVARWSEDKSRALLKLAAEGKIDFSKPVTQHSENLKNLWLKFPGRSEKVLKTHFGQLKAKALTAKSKNGARKRDTGTNLVLHLSFRFLLLTL
jgi:hypothetical protein